MSCRPASCACAVFATDRAFQANGVPVPDANDHTDKGVFNITQTCRWILFPWVWNPESIHSESWMFAYLWPVSIFIPPSFSPHIAKVQIWKGEAALVLSATLAWAEVPGRSFPAGFNAAKSISGLLMLRLPERLLLSCNLADRARSFGACRKITAKNTTAHHEPAKAPHAELTHSDAGSWRRILKQRSAGCRRRDAPGLCRLMSVFRKMRRMKSLHL